MSGSPVDSAPLTDFCPVTRRPPAANTAMTIRPRATTPRAAAIGR